MKMANVAKILFFNSFTWQKMRGIVMAVNSIDLACHGFDGVFLALLAFT